VTSHYLAGPEASSHSRAPLKCKVAGGSSWPWPLPPGRSQKPKEGTASPGSARRRYGPGMAPHRYQRPPHPHSQPAPDSLTARASRAASTVPSGTIGQSPNPNAPQTKCEMGRLAKHAALAVRGLRCDWPECRCPEKRPDRALTISHLRTTRLSPLSSAAVGHKHAHMHT
jgi:hypothetical protein